ncbi:MAG: peptidyl-prolyl cis-trans isomerase, partial [Pseudomonadota bacterium]
SNGSPARMRVSISFEGLAEQYSADSLTASQGGDFGAMTEAQYPEEVGEAVFSMDEGEIAGPIRGAFGFHVVRLDRILEAGPLPYEQIRSSLLVEMQEEQADGLFLEKQRQLSDARFDALDMASLAAASGLEIKSVEGFSRSGGQPFGASDAVINAVFAPAVLAGDDLTDVIDVDAERTVVIAVTKHNPAVRQPLDAVRDQIAQSLTASQSEQLMVAKAQEMQSALENGEDFAVAAAAAGATVNAPMSLRREDAQADQFLQAAVFAAPKPSQDQLSVGLSRNGNGGYTVYRIEAVMPGRPEAIPLEERDAGKLQLTDTYGIGDFRAFIQQLRTNADVIINEDALAAQDLFQ